jgi:hypothetical protein
MAKNKDNNLRGIKNLRGGSKKQGGGAKNCRAAAKT